MNRAVVFGCSHRRGGNTDRAVNLLADGVREAGGDAEVLFVRNYEIQPCLACGYCDEATHLKGRARCVLGPKDDTHELFNRLFSARTVLLASPIYFYHLPSMFKAWIDRSQQFWTARNDGESWVADLPKRTAHVVLVAGRPRGDKLFEGSLLTLKYFLANFNIELADPLLLRGIEDRTDLADTADLEQQLIELGRSAWESA